METVVKYETNKYISELFLSLCTDHTLSVWLHSTLYFTTLLRKKTMERSGCVNAT